MSTPTTPSLNPFAPPPSTTVAAAATPRPSTGRATPRGADADFDSPPTNKRPRRRRAQSTTPTTPTAPTAPNTPPVVPPAPAPVASKPAAPLNSTTVSISDTPAPTTPVPPPPYDAADIYITVWRDTGVNHRGLLTYADGNKVAWRSLDEVRRAADPSPTVLYDTPADRATLEAWLAAEFHDHLDPTYLAVPYNLAYDILGRDVLANEE